LVILTIQGIPSQARHDDHSFFFVLQHPRFFEFMERINQIDTYC